MKIVIASPLYPPEIGGPATYTKELVERLHTDHELTIVTYTNNTENMPGSKLIAVSKNSSLPIRLIKFFWAMMAASKEADVIYVQNAMAAGLPAVLAAKLRRKPIVLKFVGDEAWERASQHRKTEKRLVEFLAEPDAGFKIKLMMMVQGFVLRNVSIVTTPSQYLGEVIQKTYNIKADRVKTNYNAAEKTTNAPFEAEKKPHQIAASARLVAWKGVDGIIRAVKTLKDTYPDVHLVVNGDGPERDNLEKLATELDVTNHVTFTGNVSRTETWHTRQESEVYVLNSTYEGLPHTALTSFAAGIPMVATDIPGTNEAVYNEESGLLIKPENSDELAAAITKLFENPELQNKIVAGGKKILTEKFSWEVHQSNLLGFFESVLSKPIN